MSVVSLSVIEAAAVIAGSDPVGRRMEDRAQIRQMRAHAQTILAAAREAEKLQEAIIVQIYPDHPSHEGAWEKWRAMDEIERLVEAALSALRGPREPGGNTPRFKGIDWMGGNPSCWVACPTCGAPAGYYCNDARGPIDGPHHERRSAAAIARGEPGEDADA